jgi:nitrous oxide reductase accessory protein NosL
MRRAIVIVVAFVALTVAGCKSKQDQLVELNAQFDSQNAQYQKNCLLAPAEVIQRTQAECKAQRDKMNPLGKKIIDLQNDIAASKR